MDEWIEGSPPVRAGPLPRAAQLQLGNSGGSILRVIGGFTPDPGDGTLFGTVSGHVICAAGLPGDEAQTTQLMRAVLCRDCWTGLTCLILLNSSSLLWVLCRLWGHCSLLGWRHQDMRIERSGSRSSYLSVQVRNSITLPMNLLEQSFPIWHVYSVLWPL